MIKKCILCLNLGYGGGCVYYANRILENLNIPKEVWISANCDEPYEHPCRKVYVSKGLKNMLWQTVFVLPWYILMVCWRIITGRYSQILVFGPHNWDFAFLFIFKIFGKTGSYVIHDGIMHEGEKDRIHQFLLVSCLKNTSQFIFLSENVRNIVVQKLKMNKRSVIIPHGIVRYSNEKSASSGLSAKPTLLMIGRISYYKGIDLLIDALPLIDFSRIEAIIIAGEVSPNLQLPDLSMYPQVYFYNRWLTVADFDEYTRKADFILMPYREATQSGIAAVSIGYRKPAIVTRVGAMEEQLRDAAFYVDELTAKALANTINTVCNDENAYLLVKNKLKILSEDYSWNVLAKKLETFINSTK